MNAEGCRQELLAAAEWLRTCRRDFERLDADVREAQAELFQRQQLREPAIARLRAAEARLRQAALGDVADVADVGGVGQVSDLSGQVGDLSHEGRRDLSNVPAEWRPHLETSTSPTPTPEDQKWIAETQE